MERDQVYVPKTRSQVTVTNGEDIHNLVSDAPIVNVFQIVVMLLIGWPAYLATNAWGQVYGRRTNHFEPSSPIFKKEQFLQIVLSDLGIVVMLLASYVYSLYFGKTAYFMYYFVPYLWCNFWLVLITYLQHTDTAIPHFRGEEWNFMRGALCTVDRNYGILNHFFHHIGDTHVAHHLFSTMPHYHAEEATRALKSVLGKYYLSDTETPVLKALWRSWTSCHFVEDKGNVLFYKQVDFSQARTIAKKTQ
jgi:omega-6 fatty acid desaturase (delta-12 desaturase)